MTSAPLACVPGAIPADARADHFALARGARAFLDAELGQPPAR